MNQVRALVRKPGYEPLNKLELAKQLQISSKHRGLFKQVISELEKSGEIYPGKKQKYRLSTRKTSSGGRGTNDELVEGRITFSRDQKSQNAFFIPSDPDSHKAFEGMDRPRLFVPGRHSANALDGDTVAVTLSKSPPPQWSRGKKGKPDRNKKDDEWIAKVSMIVKRERTQIVGIYHSKGSRHTIAPDDGRLPSSFRLTNVLPEARPGQMVVADFSGWSDPKAPPTAEMIEVLGEKDAPGVDMLAIIHRYGLPLHFPDKVVKEADLIDEAVPKHELERREDWREREVFTIDPEDAKDFDDAICVTTNPKGGWELAVHIADVSHYVYPGTELDKEASKRGNSVYLADRVIPMLPEKLSNGVCSLKPHVERLTHVAIIDFDKNGKPVKSRFASAVIRSHRRYSYEEAHEIMMMDVAKINAFDDKKEKSLGLHLKRAWELASKIRKLRFENGALELDFPEIKVVLDDKGRAVDIKRSEYDESHQMIEEFMLSANEAVAYEIKNAPAPSIYRVHDDPDPGKLEDFANLARSFGHQVGDVSHRPELQKLLKNVRGKLEEQSVKIALLKSLKRAVYSNESAGHYGLAKANYTHFTSPIRRYSDLIVHRVLRRILAQRGEPSTVENAQRTPNVAGMAEIAEHISKTERVAAEAEMDTRKLKLIEYIERVTQNDPNTVFQATVTDVNPAGAFLELDELNIRGMIRKDDLNPKDEYFFDGNQNQFRSKTKKPALSIGHPVKVRLHTINRSRGFIDFVPV